MLGFDLLGAIPVDQHKRDQVMARASQAGQRAINAGHRIARRAPRLARAVIAAGQKALSAGGKIKLLKKPSAQSQIIPKKAPAGGVQTGKLRNIDVLAKPPGAMVGPMGKIVALKPSRALQAPQYVPRPSQSRSSSQGMAFNPRANVKTLFVPPAHKSLMARGTRVGDEETAAEEYDFSQADIYAALAAAAAAVAEFVAGLQEYVDYLPLGSALATRGETIIAALSIRFGDGIERGLRDKQTAEQTSRQLVQELQDLLNQKADGSGVWQWVTEADAYFEAHPEASSNRAALFERPSWESQTTFSYGKGKGGGYGDAGGFGGGGGDSPPTDPSGGTPGVVARVVVTPIEITLAPGITQLFTVQATDATGKPVTPRSIAWSASGGVVDQTGSFGSNQAGTFTVTATADGITGTGTAIVQAAGAGAGAGTSTSDPYGTTTDPYGTTPPVSGPPGFYDYGAGSDPGADPYGADSYGGDPYGGYDPFGPDPLSGYDAYGNYYSDPAYAVFEGEGGYEEYDPFATSEGYGFDPFQGYPPGYLDDSGYLPSGDDLFEGAAPGLDPFEGAEPYGYDGLDEGGLEEEVSAGPGDEALLDEGEGYIRETLIGHRGGRGGGRGRGHRHGGRRHHHHHYGGPWLYEPTMWIVDGEPDEDDELDEDTPVEEVA